MNPAPDWALPRVFAHRCGGALAPENTLAGMPITAALGVAAIEFDVMLSAAGTPWLIHDETLERTTNGKGRVCDTADGVLRGLDAGAFHHPAFAGERLPTFAEAAKLCRTLGLQANVEIKPARGFEAATGSVVAEHILDLWQGAPLPLVSSFSLPALHAARRAAPQLPLGLLWARPPADWIGAFEAISAYSLHLAWDKLDDAVLGVARQRQIPVLCWTVNDPAIGSSLLARGVTSIISDRPDRLRGV